MRRLTRTGAIICLLTAAAAAARAHCQIPCGIYDDPARIKALHEHITTVEKSMKLIHELSEADKPDYNQLVRWVRNKEEHVEKINEIVTYYFMAQRVAPAEPGDGAARATYVKQLTLLHGILVNAMKAKQTTDLKYVETLRELVDSFDEAYGAHGHGHAH